MTASPEDWLAELTARLGRLGGPRGRRRQLCTVTSLPDHRVRLGGQTYLNLASNDYLGLGADWRCTGGLPTHWPPRARLEKLAFTASASRLLGGEHAAYGALEQLLSEAYGHNRQTLVFSSGYHANVGILPALVQRDDMVLADRLVHASLVDGIRLCRGSWTRYRHNDLNHLQDLLEHRGPRRARRMFIVTESLFSMDGDRADLPAIAELKQRYGAVLYVDEAPMRWVCHGARGLAEEQGVLPQVDVLLGTFGKALASSGAYAIVASPLRDYLINAARSLIFTTAMPPVMVWWTLWAVRHALEAHDRRVRTPRACPELPAGLGVRGGGHAHRALHSRPGLRRTARLSEQLRQRGYWVPPIRPPTVPEGTARLRFSLGAGMGAGRSQRIGKGRRDVEGKPVKATWLGPRGRPSALVFFAGWGMDDRPFRRLTSLRFDVLVCYDYRDPGNTAATAELSAVAEYPDVTVIAWSLGCAAAAWAMFQRGWSPRAAVAINGTVTPEDDEAGIPVAVDVRHCRRIGRRRLAEVVRRPCAWTRPRAATSSARRAATWGAQWRNWTPYGALVAPSGMRLHTALVGTRDRIILPENQHARLGASGRTLSAFSPRRTIPFTSGTRGSKCWPPVLRPRNLATADGL